MLIDIALPTKPGQICRLSHRSEVDNPTDVYIVVEDPSAYSDDDDIYVVNLKDLQRNLSNPYNASQLAVAKGSLNVIADNLEEYIKGWNG